MLLSTLVSNFVNFFGGVLAIPATPQVHIYTPSRYYDIQGHRGGRGHTIENTLPGFAWGLINGVTTLELDNGITKDGHVVIWHDESITPEKCQDTGPVETDDSSYPYVGKYIANLTLAQIQTLDCGSKRQAHYPLQLLYPETRIPTLNSLFSFLSCADPHHRINLNIESKSDAAHPERTRPPEDFVKLQSEVFKNEGRKWLDGGKITYQSFDWRTLVLMKDVDTRVHLSALIEELTLPTSTSPSPWLANTSLSSFPGPSISARISQAAKSIGAHILSPSALTDNGEDWFTTKEMVDEAHRLGMEVIPWTVNNLNIVETLVREWSVDGIITDYPADVRRWAKQAELKVAPRYSTKKVMSCLEAHSHK